MANCILCTKSLSFFTRPTFGQGRLADGTEICYKCFSKNGSSKRGFKYLTSQQLIESVNNPFGTTFQVSMQINNTIMEGFATSFGNQISDEETELTDDTVLSSPPGEPAIHKTIDVADHLLKLADLRDKGILTDQEFRAQKYKLLND